MTTVEKAEKAMRDLLDCTNVMGSDKDVAEAISNVLSKEHRTLQQSFMRVFVQSMNQYKDTRFDQRNEQAVKLAKEITEIDTLLPFI